jgi:hypothetical protein
VFLWGGGVEGECWLGGFSGDVLILKRKIQSVK